MACFPDQGQIQSAISRTRACLGLNFEALIDCEETSVFLKYLLLQGLETAEIRYWRTIWRQNSCAGLQSRLHELLAAIQIMIKTPLELPGETILEQAVGGLLFLPAGDIYWQRISELAVEAVLSEPLAPEICLKLAPIALPELPQALPGNWQHAVIFASPYFFSHEFYPLAVDAYVLDSALCGSSRINVLGVHIDWLAKDNRLKRILYADFAAGRLIEADLLEPIVADSVQFLCLGKNEQTIHKTVSRRFSCLQFNPAAASAIADNKAATLMGWESLGLDVPDYRIVAEGDWAAADTFLNEYAEIVVKPNKATEGEGVAYFERDLPQTRSALAQHLEACWRLGTVLVQQRRDGVCYREPLTGKLHTLVLRLNLSSNGAKQPVLESGYVQIGQDLQHPAAGGSGGRILSLAETLPNLCRRSVDISIPVSLNIAAWKNIQNQAEQAAGFFPDLKLLGLDVLLDLDGLNNIIPVFLEANPRPAGLSHSRLLSDDPFAAAEIGVSLGLWDQAQEFSQAKLS